MKLVVGNQKAYAKKSEILNFINETNNVDCCSTIICPSYIYIDLFAEKSNYIIGAQNVASTSIGAHTGEICAEQLKELNVQFCIVGHSERRKSQYEDSELIYNKINNLLTNDIRPILCVGESMEDKENGIAKDVVAKQVMDVFNKLNVSQIAKIIIAYEPIWAIGSGLIPSKEEIEDVTSYIKDLIKDKYDFDILVLYGGSVNKKNIDDLNTIDIVDGYLIGGSSVKPDEFLYIMSQCNKME